ncbi:MAG TPA: CvpA family protein [Candidatus Dormibacteraeota bacterium]|nr:CvpA family protein [Candidatus Dormibacteraeota bacterium]
MNLVDIGIVVVIGLGVLIGWRNGLIGPLLAEGTFLLSYWIVSTHPSLAGLVPSSVPRPLAIFLLPIALALVVGFAARTLFQSLFRLPLTKQLDTLLGAAANGALAFVIVYVVLLGLAGAGRVLDPLSQVRSIQPTQVAAMRMLLAENPQAAGLVPSSELGQLANVASTHPVPLTQLGQYAQVINYYERTLRPQLAASQLAPVVLQYGARLPIIGRHVTLPKA